MNSEESVFYLSYTSCKFFIFFTWCLPSNLNYLLKVSRKLNYKNLMKDCLAIMCKLYQTNAEFADDLISSEESVTQPAENFDTAATIALLEIGNNTCIAMQKFLILVSPSAMS